MVYGGLVHGLWWFSLWFMVVYSAVHGGLLCGLRWFSLWSVVVYSMASQLLISSRELVDTFMVKTGSPADQRECSLEVWFVPHGQKGATEVGRAPAIGF